MKGGRQYDIFPRTFGPRLLLALAFLGGLGIIGGSIAAFAIAVTSGLLDEVEVTVENRTSQDVTIYLHGLKEAALPAGETTTITDLKLAWRFGNLVEAVDANGILVFQDELDLDDLKRTDYRIVLREPPCSGPGLESCLAEQTELRAIARRFCGGSGRRVCLVPLGQVRPALVRHLVDHYADEYGLAVTVLTPSAIPRGLVNPDRRQIEGGALIEYAGSLFPEAYLDPSAVLIGLTPADLYIESRDWRFAFGVRGTFADPKGVVSTFRMDPESFGAVPDDDLLFSRARKLVSRYIGLMYYDLPLSDDPRTLMFDNILSVRDLDRMEEPLPVDARR